MILKISLIVILLNEIRGEMKLIHGDCLKVMDALIREEVRVDAIICDPPY